MPNYTSAYTGAQIDATVSDHVTYGRSGMSTAKTVNIYGAHAIQDGDASESDKDNSPLKISVSPVQGRNSKLLINFTGHLWGSKTEFAAQEGNKILAEYGIYVKQISDSGEQG